MPPQEQGICQIHCIAIKRAIAGCFKPVCTGGAKQFDNLGSKQVIAVICITVSPCHLHPHPQHPHIFFCISIKDLHVTPGHCLAPLHPCQCLLVSPPTGPHPHVPAGSQPATMSPCHAPCIPVSQSLYPHILPCILWFLSSPHCHIMPCIHMSHLCSLMPPLTQCLLLVPYSLSPRLN